MPQSINRVYSNGEEVSSNDIHWTKDAAKEHLKTLRYDRETAGVIVDGVSISTERGDHRNTILALALAGSQNPSLQVPFKLTDGSFTILSGAFASAAWAFGQSYVAQCFAVEAQASDLIGAAETDAEIDAILAALQWPTQEYTT